jgi:hypothetical protein
MFPQSEHIAAIMQRDFYAEHYVCAIYKLTKLITNSVELRAPLERPQVVQPLGRFPVFYGTRRFITEFT